MKRGYADAPHGQIHYIQEGRGEPLVFVHQTPRSSAMFRKLMAQLADDYRTIAIDLPGYGESDPPPVADGRANVKEIGASVFNVLDALGIERTHLFGIHTGAYMAAQAAAQTPERVASLVIYGFPFFADDSDKALYDEKLKLPEWARARGRTLSRDGSHLITMWASALSHVQRRWLLEGGPRDDDAPAEYLRVPSQHRPPNAFITDDDLAFIEQYITDSRRAKALPEIYEVMVAPNADLLASIDVPTLHIDSDTKHESPWCLQGQRIVSVMPNCRNTTLPQSDDNSCEFDAPRVAELLRDFYGQHSQSVPLS